MTPNVPLLRKVMEHIEAHPEQHVQRSWRCGTGMCFAGWAADFSGLEWVYDPDHLDAELVYTDDDAVLTAALWEVDEVNGRTAVPVVYAAQRVLGLTARQARWLFASTHSRANLREIVTSLAGGEL